MVSPPKLEDLAEDVLGKALHGQQKDTAALAREVGVDRADVEAALEGRADPEVYARLAPALGLAADRLEALAAGSLAPPAIEVDDLTIMTMPFPQGYPGMTVNAFLVSASDRDEAIVFDAGADAGPIREALMQRGQKLAAIFLTHTHGDHVAGLDDLRQAWPEATVHVSEDEPHPGAATFAPGETFHVAGLKLTTTATPGHSPGGTTYEVHGLNVPLAVVGDAIFAASLGGIRQDYKGSLARLRDLLATLDPATVLAPGHGPLTTVAWERAHNPFFPGLD